MLVYVTFPTLSSAKKISLTLLREKKIACANIFPVFSFYVWKGKIEKAREYVAIMKTKKYKPLERRLKQLHPYTLPAIIKINSRAEKNFEKWVKDETL